MARAMHPENESILTALEGIDFRRRITGHDFQAERFLQAMLFEVPAYLFGEQLERTRMGTGTILFEIGKVAPIELQAYLDAASGYDMALPRPWAH